jgi:hypothetical protein
MDFPITIDGDVCHAHIDTENAFHWEPAGRQLGLSGRLIVRKGGRYGG